MEHTPGHDPRRAIKLGILGVSGCVITFVVAFYTALNSASVAPEEIARRCRESRPVWQNYQEDVKGQIGARAAATWHGVPTRLELADGTARLTMQITGPWTGYVYGIPILLRDPQGNTSLSIDAGPPGEERTYTFALPTKSVPPWVEIHYPHAERRLALTAEGTWSAPAN